MSEERKSIGAGKIKQVPEKRLRLTIGNKAVKAKNLAEGSVTPQKISSDFVEYVTADVQNQIDSIQIGGWAISNQLGDDPHIGISQKALTELIGYDSQEGTIRGRIKHVEDEIGSDTTSTSLSGRVTSLEAAVGSGGSVDERIAQSKAEVIGDADSNHNTLGKLEDKIQEEASARAYAINAEATARINAINNEVTARNNAISIEASARNTAVENEASVRSNADTAETERAQAAEELLRQTYEALTQTDIVVGALPGSGVANTIYRVPGVSSYSDYMWYGSTFVEMAEYDNATDDEPTLSSNNLVKSGGVASVCGSVIDNQEFLRVVTDSGNKVLYGVERDGNFYFGAGIPVQIKDEIDTLNRNIEKEIDALKEVDEGTKTSIFSLNTAQEYGPAIQALVAKHYNSVSGNWYNKPTTLVWFTDPHGDSEAYARINEWSERYGRYVDDIITTGDNVQVQFYEDFSWWTNEKILQVLGNHDSWASRSDFDATQYPGLTFDDMVYGNFSSTRYIIKQKYVYDKFIAPYVQNWNVVQPNNAETKGLCFFYKDYGSVRLIVLDGNHYDRGDYLVDGVDVQAIWLRNVLADALANSKSCVISCHYQPSTMDLINCPFNRDEGRHALNPTPYVTDAADAVSDFIGAGGDFICWISGHRHYDFIGTCSSTENSFFVICLTTSSWSYDTTNAGKLNMREIDTKTQDAFAMISFDPSLGLVKLLKVGADTNENMERARNLVYRYKDVTDEYGNVLEKGLVLCN